MTEERPDRALASLIGRLLAATSPGPATHDGPGRARESSADPAAGWDQLENLVFACVQCGLVDAALASLQRLLEKLPVAGDRDARSSSVHPATTWITVAQQSRLWWLQGVLLHDQQHYEPALEAMTRAARLDSAEPALLGQAQLCFETGRPAAAQFAQLHARLPHDPQLIRNLAGALAAEGDSTAAERVLSTALRRQPDWLEGQRLLATLRHTQGVDAFDAGYAEALAANPVQPALWLAWFQALATAKRWAQARQVLDRAVARLGEQRALAVSRLYLAAESGAANDLPDLFAAVPENGDPGLGLARVRHALRCGDPAAASRLASRFLTMPAAPLFWPYQSLAWRLLDDPRAAWLDRPEVLIREFDLGLAPAELTRLAGLLRALHTQAAPYHEQSVRGGTQTDRPLLARHDPVIVRLRAALQCAVLDYVRALPPAEEGHPLLAPHLRADLTDPAVGPSAVRFAGSWSVRLADAGFHACHTHPRGWLSSACYVALPPDPGPAPAGCLQFGAPPAELGLPLAPYRTIEPKAGHLVLFPSTLWHGTAPFRAGERLTVAFDVMPGRPGAR